jgi:hypothetical protein
VVRSPSGLPLEDDAAVVSPSSVIMGSVMGLLPAYRDATSCGRWVRYSTTLVWPTRSQAGKSKPCRWEGLSTHPRFEERESSTLIMSWMP